MSTICGARSRRSTTGRPASAGCLTRRKPDADEFWRKVKTNLRASNVRLMVAADEIPDSLARVVEFLNEQMHDVDVLAVEIKRYIGGGRENVLSRASSGARPNPEAWAAASPSTTSSIGFPLAPSAVPRNRSSIARARLARPSSPGHAGFPSAAAVDSGLSRSRWRGCTPPRSVGCAPGIFSFGAALFSGYDPPAPAALREVLLRYTGLFEHDPYANDASSQGVVAWSIEPEAAAQYVRRAGRAT